MKRYKIVLLTFLISVGLASCSDDDSNANVEQTAHLRVELTDAPGDYDKVFVEVEDVMIKRESDSGDEEGWVSLEDVRTGTYDLLTLTGGETQLLADTEIPAGYLDQIRLVLGDNNSIEVDGASYTLKTPSAQTSGLKLKVEQELAADIEYSFILDFDVDQSVVKAGESGNYNLHPVLRLSAVAETGSIVGTVHPNDYRALVVAQDATTTVSAFTNEEGEFKLNGLPAGTYRLTVTPDEDSENVTTVVNNVRVEVGKVTELEDVVFLDE